MDLRGCEVLSTPKPSNNQHQNYYILSLRSYLYFSQISRVGGKHSIFSISKVAKIQHIRSCFFLGIPNDGWIDGLNFHHILEMEYMCQPMIPHCPSKFQHPKSSTSSPSGDVNHRHHALGTSDCKQLMVGYNIPIAGSSPILPPKKLI